VENIYENLSPFIFILILYHVCIEKYPLEKDFYGNFQQQNIVFKKYESNNISIFVSSFTFFLGL